MGPRNRDHRGTKVKTDRRDALALVSCLGRYVAGNTEALAGCLERRRCQHRAETHLLPTV